MSCGGRGTGAVCAAACKLPCAQAAAVSAPASPAYKWVQGLDTGYHFNSPVGPSSNRPRISLHRRVAARRAASAVCGAEAWAPASLEGAGRAKWTKTDWTAADTLDNMASFETLCDAQHSWQDGSTAVSVAVHQVMTEGTTATARPDCSLQALPTNSRQRVAVPPAGNCEHGGSATQCVKPAGRQTCCSPPEAMGCHPGPVCCCPLKQTRPKPSRAPSKPHALQVCVPLLHSPHCTHVIKRPDSILRILCRRPQPCR